MFLGGFYLEPFQNENIPINKLDKYNLFFRIAGDPFHKIYISEFN